MPKPLRNPIVTRAIFKRSIVVAGHRTSISLEQEFWDALKDLARLRDQTISFVVETVDKEREVVNLSSAIRLEILAEARAGRLPLRDGN